MSLRPRIYCVCVCVKALRAKTNTYIKTPIRGEAPMFVITGRREDVMTAKREIQLAADHFSQIRARRGSGGSGSGGESSSSSSSSSEAARKSPKLVNGSASSSSSMSPTETTSSSSSSSSSILTAKPSQIIHHNSSHHNHNQSTTQQQPSVAVSALGRASSVSPGSSPLCLAPLSLNSELFSSHG